MRNVRNLPGNPESIKSRGSSVQKMDDLPAHIESRRAAWHIEELSELLSVDKSVLYRMVQAGRLPGYKIGTSIRLDPKTTADWLRGQTM